MDAFAQRLVHAMGLILDASKDADLKANPEISVEFADQKDRYEFECRFKRGVEPGLAPGVTDGFRLPIHHYRINGILLKLTVKEIY